MMKLEVFRFADIFKSYIWGGRNLARVLGKTLPPDTVIAESWEIVDRDDANSVVEGGGWTGQTLREVITENPVGVMGRLGMAFGQRFPLLVKFLDAQKPLSVQVHPNDRQANLWKPGERGKTEMWYVLKADPGAKIVAGLKPNLDRGAVSKAVDEEKLVDLLRFVDVGAGDIVLMPAGKVHALGEGIVVLEIQQNSDITYRLYDWDRVDADGKGRELHIEEGLDVIEFDDSDALVTPVVLKESWGIRKILAITRYFITEEWTVNGSVTDFPAGESFRILAVVGGAFEVSWSLNADSSPVEENSILLKVGDVALVPAAVGSYTLTATESDRDTTTHEKKIAAHEKKIIVTRVPDLPGDMAVRLEGQSLEEKEKILALCDGPTRLLYSEL